MQLSHSEFTNRWKTLHMNNRKYLSFTIIALVICFLVSLCFRTITPGFIPKETFVNLIMGAKLYISKITGSSYYLNYPEFMNNVTYFSETLVRFSISVFTVFAGMALGLAGAVFQQVYHNPIASPSTIGATAGVNLGNMMIVMMFPASAVFMIVYRYVACIAFTCGIMVIVLVAGKFLGKNGSTYSVIEMLMIGSILSRLIVTFVSYVMYHYGSEAFVAYQQLNLGLFQVYKFKSVVIFLSVIAAGLVLLLKMRFRINATGFDYLEAKAVGVNLWSEQIISQMLGAVLIAVACIQCGDVGLFALVIPHMVRYMVGSDFRKLAVYSTIYGGIFLLIIRMISSMIFLGDEAIPLSFIVSIVMIPVFMVMLAMQRRGFD